MTTRHAARTAAALLLSLLAVTPACTKYKVGGLQRSEDLHVYESTTHLPITVRIRDLRDNTVLWSYDIPVERRLVIQFLENANRENRNDFPDLMAWEIMPLTQDDGPLRNREAAPPATARRIEWTLRDNLETVPEFQPVRASANAG